MAQYIGVREVDVNENVAVSRNDGDGLAVSAGRQPALTGCPWHDVNEMLQAAGLRPTRQRMALGWLLFGKGARHLTAEMLYEEATHAKVPVSLATVYNTLNQLTDAGLLRQVSVDGAKTYFDTNVSAHHHFYLEGNHELVDIPDPHLMLQKMPDVPEGYEISRIDMVVRLRKKRYSLYMHGVIRGLDPRIHRSSSNAFSRGWIAGSSPAMTAKLFHLLVGIDAP